MLKRPAFYFKRGERADFTHTHMNRMTFFVPTHGCKNRCFTWSASAAFTTFTLAAPIGVIKFDQTLENQNIISFFHDMLEFVLHAHGRIKGNAEKTVKVER